MNNISNHICQCPCCRFARKEISVDAIAWYIKGCLEKETVYYNAIKSATSLDELKQKFGMNQTNIDGDLVLLADLKTNHGLNDPAFNKPELNDFTKDGANE